MTQRHPPARGAGVADRLRNERGTVHKRWHQRRSVALIYPNSYAVGMANLGLQAVYGLFNAMEDVVCERFFTPDAAFVGPWPGPLSIESQRPLADFEILAFSIAFESDYPNVIALLKAGGLCPEAADRSDAHPLVIAGGVACWINPEPLAAVVDAFLIGEAEVLLPAFMAADDPGMPRERRLRHLAREVAGVYVPRFYHPAYRSDGTLSAYHLSADVPERVVRVRLDDLSAWPTQTSVQTVESPFAAQWLLEVSRGCPHGCRFCAAGYVYRPPRFQTLETLCACLAAVPSDIRRVGLVGAAISDLPDLDALCQRAEALNVSLGFSSFRADAISEALLAALVRSGAKTVTIAPETGSQRLRDAVNKHLTDAAILDAAGRLVAAGIPNLRLYFMIGLPGETEADVVAIADLVQRVKDRFLAASRRRGRIGTITVSLNPFVPKPFTPLQWAPMDTVAELKVKIGKVRDRLGPLANVRLNAGKARLAVGQAVLSRGDRRVGRDLLEGRDPYDGARRWTGRGEPQDPTDHALRQKDPGEPLAWEIIDHGLDRQWLLEEYRRYQQARLSPPCPGADCRRCGVCR